eukprot:UN20094
MSLPPPLIIGAECLKIIEKYDSIGRKINSDVILEKTTSPL